MGKRGRLGRRAVVGAVVVVVLLVTGLLLIARPGGGEQAVAAGDTTPAARIGLASAIGGVAGSGSVTIPVAAGRRVGAESATGSPKLKTPVRAEAAPSRSAAPAPTTAPASTTSAPVGAAQGGEASFGAQVVTLTNAQRATAGCPALTVDSRLVGAARAHSVDMATHNYFDHNSQNGTTPFQRITAAGYSFSVAAENIAAGQQTPADVMTAWMGSAGHRANILNCALRQIGVGYATGGTYGAYWTQDFGTP